MYKVGDVVRISDLRKADLSTPINSAWFNQEYFIVERESRITWCNISEYEGQSCINTFCNESQRWYSIFSRHFGEWIEPYESPFEEEWVDYA